MSEKGSAMATTLDEVMRLVLAYGAAVEHGKEWSDQWWALKDALEPIIADAQRYRSLQGKTDEQA